MSEQRVRVVNNDVGCAVIIAIVLLLIGGCMAVRTIDERLEGIQKAIQGAKK